VNAFQLPASEMLGESLTVKPVGLHSLTRYLGNHRGSGHYTKVPFSGQPIIQAPSGGTRFIGKGYFLPFEVFAHVTQQIFGSVRHAEGLESSFDGS
jgi:hypothetical protein